MKALFVLIAGIGLIGCGVASGKKDHGEPRNAEGRGDSLYISGNFGGYIPSTVPDQSIGHSEPIECQGSYAQY